MAKSGKTANRRPSAAAPAAKKGASGGVLRNLVDGQGRFSGDALKLVALITMLIDHIGAGILENILFYGPTGNGFAGSEELYRVLDEADIVLRLIGRISFPIYCYLLVQGFLFTRSRLKYALRLFLFALLSELPFDYLFFNGFTMSYQNIFWTLLIGLITLWEIETIENASFPDALAFLRPLLCLIAAAAGLLAAIALHSDYEWMGVLLILTLYATRRRKALQCILSPVVFLAALFVKWVCLGTEAGYVLEYVISSEWSVFLSFFLIWRCNGRRYMKKGKYLFYAFYPLHMLFLLLLRCIIYLA